MSACSHGSTCTLADAPAMPAGCSFDAADWYLLARHWYPLMEAEKISGSPISAMLLDQPLVLYRAGGQVVVARDACPHRGVPLSMGAPDDGGIRCAYHGLLFGAAGRCIDIPSRPGHPVPARLHLHTFPAVERYGLVWTCLWPHEDVAPDIPSMPHWGDAGFQQALCPCYAMDCFAGRQMEGFLDVAHFPWVHRTTFACAGQRSVPSYAVEETERGFSADYYSGIANYPLESGRRAPDGFIWHRQFDVHLPFAASLILHFPEGGRAVIFNIATPVSALRTHLFVPVSRNFDTERPAQEMIDFNLRVFDEDKPLMEAQRPRNLPLDVRDEAHVPADRSSLAYRRALARRGHGRFFDPARYDQLPRQVE